jgi:hypothetical protein
VHAVPGAATARARALAVAHSYAIELGRERGSEARVVSAGAMAAGAMPAGAMPAGAMNDVEVRATAPRPSSDAPPDLAASA